MNFYGDKAQDSSLQIKIFYEVEGVLFFNICESINDITRIIRSSKKFSKILILLYDNLEMPFYDFEPNSIKNINLNKIREYIQMENTKVIFSNDINLYNNDNYLSMICRIIPDMQDKLKYNYISGPTRYNDVFLCFPIERSADRIVIAIKNTSPYAWGAGYNKGKYFSFSFIDKSSSNFIHFQSEIDRVVRSNDYFVAELPIAGIDIFDNIIASICNPQLESFSYSNVISIASSLPYAQKYNIENGLQFNGDCMDGIVSISSISDEYFIYGPFVRLDPGRYDVLFFFSDVGYISSIVIDCISNDGDELTLYSRNINKIEKNLLVASFEISTVNERCEFRVFVKKNTCISFDKIVLVRLPIQPIGGE